MLKLSGRLAFSSTILVLYLSLSGSVMIVDAYLIPGRLELPWTWYWLLWGALFSPVPGIAVLLGCLAGPASRWVRVLSVGSIVVAVFAMQAGFVLDAGLSPALALVTTLCIGVFVAFAFHGTS